MRNITKTVIEEFGNTVIPKHISIRVVSDIISIDSRDDILLVFGYVHQKDSYKLIQLEFNGVDYLAISTRIKPKCIFSKRCGKYKIASTIPYGRRLTEQRVLGAGKFPYQLIEYYYAASKSLDVFKGKQEVDVINKHKLSKHLKYTIGLEFECSSGYLPQELCFKDGLIPLRDGSIRGLEYSTIVLDHDDKSLSLLQQGLQHLAEYTATDKDCSLHIHFGGFKPNSENVRNLFRVCKRVEKDLEKIIPPASFSTHEFKSNKKDYCKRLPDLGLATIEDIYQFYTDRPFFNNFTQPHPNDTKRVAKWRIRQRYLWVNFINLLCYKTCKTIEFRFLRPTYNFEKIKIWLYIFNAILAFSELPEEKIQLPVKGNSLKYILRKIYSRKVYNALVEGIEKLDTEVKLQMNDRDYCGNLRKFEKDIYTSSNIL